MVSEYVSSNKPFAFIPKHYSGAYTLGHSLWLNSLLVKLSFFLFSYLLFSWLGQDVPARYISTTVLTTGLLGLVIWTWLLIGIWNSASKHVARGGKQHWANAAKLLVLFGFFQLPMTIISNYQPLSEHWKLVTGFQPGEETLFQVWPDGKSMLLKGGINDGTAEKLLTALTQNPFVTTVVLQSAGGWVRQGDMIADIITQRKLNTYVHEECSSACTIAFLAGKERTASLNARLGFHSFASVGADKLHANMTNIVLVKKMYRKARLSEPFIEKILATSPDKIWYPSQDELFAEGVFTKRGYDGSELKIHSV